jgi:hypothetical protein
MQMATSRRNFLRVGALCALGAGVPSVVSSVADANTNKTSGIDNYRKKAFVPYLGTKFLIHGGPREKVEVVLEEIKDLKLGGSRSVKFPTKESFSLLFKADGDSVRLGQNTYDIEHSNGEVFTLFLVPIRKPDSGYFEAVIITA